MTEQNLPRRLGRGALPQAAARGVRVPSHPRPATAGVVHLGLGAFHRCHQALVFNDLLARGDTRWGILGVAMHSPAVAAGIAAQDGLYAVLLADAQGQQWHVCGALSGTCVAAQDPDAVVRAMASPAARWVTLTVTEKGYGDPLAALLLRGFAARRAAGLGGLTVASCDNLQDNGRKLQALCERAAAADDPALAQWIRTRCAFPNSMVDRIVPATSESTFALAEEALGVRDGAALRTESFWEWVIERRFVDATDADVLASAGVQVVDEVAPFEEAKLRLLNASHSAMACIGALAGLPHVSDVVAQPVTRAYVHDLMSLELGPLVRRPDWQAYRDHLLLRFANASLAHRVHQIASDSSQKITQRWVPPVRDALQAGRPVERLAFAAASWVRFCQGRDEAGQAYALSDPLAAQLQELARRHAGDATAAVSALCGITAIWGEVLPANRHWMARVAHWLQAIQSGGVLAALAQLDREAA